MLKQLLRVAACILVPWLGSDYARAETRKEPEPPTEYGILTAEASLSVEALAPAAGGSCHSFDHVRANIVHQYKELLARGRRRQGGDAKRRERRLLAYRSLPRYVGAGETSVHKAIRHAEQLLRENRKLEAMTLLDELRDDLFQAQKNETNRKSHG